MNLIEEVGKELRKRGFRNEVLTSLERVVECICDYIYSLTADVVRSITAHSWTLCSIVNDCAKYAQ